MGYSRTMQSAWLTDVRKLALLNCIFSFLATLVPAARVMAQLNPIPKNTNWSVWMIVALAGLVAVLYLAFFWALYRDPSRIVLSAQLRLVALGAVIVLLAIGFRTFEEWAFGIRNDWSFVTQQEWRTGARSLRGWLGNPATIQEFATSTNIADAVAYVFFLIALFRQTSGSARSEVQVSRLLAVVTKISVVVAGLIFALLLFRVLYMPYLYSQMRQMAAQVGRNLPPLLYVMRDTIRDLLLGACYLTAPFLAIWVSAGAGIRGLKMPGNHNRHNP